MNIISKVKGLLTGENRQRFFNFAYSIGAAVVIWGALFKILHLPGGNMLLSIGMGTEVLMFILTAFDRPAREYHWEDVFPALNTGNPEDRPEQLPGGVVVGGQPASGGVVVVGGGVGGGSVAAASASASGSVAVSGHAPIVVDESDPGSATGLYVQKVSEVTNQMEQLLETTAALNKVSETLLQSYRAITDNSENITQSSTGYVEQMQALNRNISGLNTIYEIQLKSVSSQLDAIDRVNRGIKDICNMYETTAQASSRYCQESERMAQYMHQLNQVYAKMLHAMTINTGMPVGMPPMPAAEPVTEPAGNPVEPQA
ncbi:MAG: gliding motility protein GldL [Paramuribaculum sp.]|nr:gliding motility protein GldL [Paramuribaculum sp.]